ncbi:gamma-glutamylcyclotransferase [Hellea balneolensis]|uniref:gamma-glutamylcyclotransferase n=1 Tax=Hellea balneolensis TaxID=287478 RepID=UPI0004063A18|nr:gamma-glutamylcyclotransferase [Hellea balneolensis]
MKTVIGYASLLSPISIKRLFPNARNITPVKIPGHARCFNSYGTLSIAKGLAQSGDKELAHAAAILRPDTTLYALAFELDEADFKTYERHEFRYDLQEVEATSRVTGGSLSAIICYEGADHLIDTSLVGVSDIYALYAQYGVSAFWHTQHLPADIYLKHCLAAARELGEDWVSNFLDSSFIHDRETSMREYLADRGVDIEVYVAAAKLSDVF